MCKSTRSYQGREQVTGKPASFTNIAFDSGRIYERKRITEIAKQSICFDHQATAACDHADCYALDQLIADINEEQTSA